MRQHSSGEQEAESDVDYDSNQDDEEEDSIVDIEDCNGNDDSRSHSPKQMASSPGSGQSVLASPNSLAGHVPIRPTPFSALAAAAVAWGGMGGGVPWPGSRQMGPFGGPPGLFPGGTFGPGGMTGK